MASTSSSTTISITDPPILVSYNWSISSEAVKNCLYDDNDIFYESDDYQDDYRLESPKFGADVEPDKFVMKLYPRSTEGCADVGSLLLVLDYDGALEDELKIERFKVSIASYSKQEEKCIDGICRKSTILTQGLGWRNTFAWKDYIRNSSNINIYCEISYTPRSPFKKPSTTNPTTRSYHQQRLSEDFGTLRNRSQFSDIVLVTENGTQFPAHKAILSARSSVFDAMFAHEQMAESVEQKVLITDIVPEVMEPFLAYIYTGDTVGVEEWAPELLAAADKYDIQSLIKVCVQSMLNQITSESAAKLYYTADLYRLVELKSQAIDFINRNPRTVIGTEGWNEYVKPRSDLIQELYGDLADKTVSGLSRFR